MKSEQLDNNKGVNDALENMWKVAQNAAEKFNQTNQKVNDLQTQIDLVNNSLSEKQEELNTKESLIAELSTSINDKNARLTSQYNEIDDLQTQIKRLSELEDKYIALLNENSNYKIEAENHLKVNTELKTIRQKIIEQNNIISELKQKNETLEELARDNSQVLQNYEFAQKEIVSKKLELIQKDEEIEKLKIKIFEFESLALNTKDNTEQKHILEQENNELKDKIDKINLEIKELQIQYDNEKLQLVSKNISHKEELKNSYFAKQFLQNLADKKETENLQLIDKINKNEELICNYLGKIQTYEEAKQISKNKISLLENQLNTLTSALQELKQDSDNNSERLLARANKINFLERCLLHEQSRVSALETSNSTLESECLSLSNKLSSFDGTSSSLLARANKINFLERCLLHEQSRVSSLESDLSTLESSYSSSKSERLSLEISLVNSNKKIQELEDNEKHNAQKMVDMANSLQTAKNQLESLLSKNSELQNTVEQYNNNEAEQLHAEKENLLEIIEELTGKININEDKIAQLLADKTEIQRTNVKLNKELKKNNKVVDAFEKLNQKNEENLTIIAELKKDLKYYKNRAYDENSLFAPENMLPQENNLEKELEKIKKENAKILSKNKALTNQLKDQEESNKALTNQLKDQEESNKALTNQLKDQEESNKALTNQLKDQEESNKALTNQLKDQEEINKELTNQLKDKEQSNKKTAQKAKKTKKQVVQEESEVDSTELDIANKLEGLLTKLSNKI